MNESNWLRELAVRVGYSSLVWFAFGVVAGICIAPQPTPIGVVAGIIAGVIMMTPVGVVMGLIGGRWPEMLVGGAVGLAGGVVVAFAQGSAWGQTAAVGLVSGGLVGATVMATLWRFPRLLMRLIAPRNSDRPIERPALA